MEELLKNYTLNCILNGFVAVDSFFYLSGFLVGYLLIKTLKKTNGKFNVFIFYLHRYIRLTPAMAIVIGFLATFWVDMQHGPSIVNNITGKIMKDNCINYSWTNFLYVNNLVHIDNMCLGQTWYLANDMQFFMISPLILYPLFRWPKVGYGILAVFTVASIAVPMAITAHFDLPASSFLGPLVATGGTLPYMQYYYFAPYCRFGPYIIGLGLGYFLATYGTNFKINKVLVIVGWLVSSISALAVLYGLSTAVAGDKIMTSAENIIYNGLHKTVWALSLSWVTFACVTGNGGFVNTFLSWKLWIPLSRLTYCTYLIHLQIMYSWAINSKTLYHFDHLFCVCLFFAFLLISLFFALAISLSFEVPFAVFDQIALGALSRKMAPAKKTQN